MLLLGRLHVGVCCLVLFRRSGSVCEHTSKGRGRGTQTRKTAIFFWYSVSAAWAAMVWMGERKKQQQQQLRQAAKKEVERKKSTGGKRRKKKTKRKAECELRKKKLSDGLRDKEKERERDDGRWSREV